MSDGFKRLRIEDRDFGVLQIVCLIPKTDPETGAIDSWGGMRDLEESGYPVKMVSGFSLSQALYGNAGPLMREIGPEPKHLAKRVKGDVCSLFKGCPLAQAKVCFPNPKVPICYESTHGGNVAAVVRFWSEGCYVIRTDGTDFTL